MQSFSKTLQKKQCCPIRPLLRPPTHVLDLFTSPPTQKAPNRLTFRNRSIRCPSMLTHFPLREGGQAYLPGQCCTLEGGRWWLPGGGHDQQWVRQAKQCTQGKLLSKKKAWFFASGTNWIDPARSLFRDWTGIPFVQTSGISIANSRMRIISKLHRLARLKRARTIVCRRTCKKTCTIHTNKEAHTLLFILPVWLAILFWRGVHLN